MAWLVPVYRSEPVYALCKKRNDTDRALYYEKIAKELLESIEKNAWDGGWYRRAYFDDGTPLGSEINEECQIDSISQSWAIISGGGKESRVKEAMLAVDNYLVNTEDGIIKLLMRPFDKSKLEPGYIKGYLPGIRENGGQYTHAAVWTVLANAVMGNGDKAMDLYHMINPVNHSRTSIEMWKYKVEPYVVAADVYAVPPHTGRGGWTWYTGSASWMYRVGVEHLLGLKLKRDGFTIDPCIPRAWKEYEITYTRGSTVYNIKVENPHGAASGVAKISMDGSEYKDKIIPFSEDGKTHTVLVTMGDKV